MCSWEGVTEGEAGDKRDFQVQEPSMETGSRSQNTIILPLLLNLGQKTECLFFFKVSSRILLPYCSHLDPRVIVEEEKKDSKSQRIRKFV